MCNLTIEGNQIYQAELTGFKTELENHRVKVT